ncbi:ELKS/Rab6-interacting/CAST family member 1-like [Oopsacas minuta]|uniref:ELKS/Rab6-interacting/CAST family member 1-like n=1 Tax=Oopsacas minuta TaxID=111878 RepID=A0AAV7K9N3_9METZ|nr:ELKS/Rab6-interacting/CAST family member 1-like [Oopsacas minuta]
MLQRTSLQKERRMLLEQLKRENATLASLLDPLANEAGYVERRMVSSNEHHSLVLQLDNASIGEVKQSLIKVFTGIQQLRLYLDQVLALVLEYKPSLLEGMPRIQVTPYNLDSSGPGIHDQWDDLSKDQLLNQLGTYENDNLSLQQYISQLLERVVVQIPYLVEKIRAIDKPVVNILKEN